MRQWSTGHRIIWDAFTVRKRKVPMQNPICGRIGERVTSNPQITANDPRAETGDKVPVIVNSEQKARSWPKLRCRSTALMRLVQGQFTGPRGSTPHLDQHFNGPWNTLIGGRSSAACKPHDR